MDRRPEEERTCPLKKGSPTGEAGRASREARLEAIRTLVDSGVYDVPAMAVAERMLNRVTPERQGRRGLEPATQASCSGDLVRSATPETQYAGSPCGTHLPPPCYGTRIHGSQAFGGSTCRSPSAGALSIASDSGER